MKEVDIRIWILSVNSDRKEIFIHLLELQSFYFFSDDFWQRDCLPGVIDGNEGNVSLCHQPGFRRAVKVKLKDDGLFFDFFY